MVRMGMVVVMGAIMVSMAVALYSYTLYQPSIAYVNEGEPVVVGPVEYSIMFQRVHPGSEQVVPENSFVQIRIDMRNLEDRDVIITGGQFYIIDDRDARHQPTYGNGTLSHDDLLREVLEPDRPISRTTQFDVPFDEDFQYQVIIRPTKEHDTADVAIVCITNC